MKRQDLRRVQWQYERIHADQPHLPHKELWRQAEQAAASSPDAEVVKPVVSGGKVGLVLGVIALIILGVLFVLFPDATAEQAVSNADARIEQAAEIIGSRLGSATRTDDWDVSSCVGSIKYPGGDERVAGRSMEWSGVSEADARELLQVLETRWLEDGSAYFYDGSEGLSTRAIRDGFSISAWFWLDPEASFAETLTVGVSTHCTYTGRELREAF
jgi:hypothetical protein